MFNHPIIKFAAHKGLGVFTMEMEKDEISREDLREETKKLLHKGALNITIDPVNGDKIYSIKRHILYKYGYTNKDYISETNYSLLRDIALLNAFILENNLPLSSRSDIDICLVEGPKVYRLLSDRSKAPATKSPKATHIITTKPISEDYKNSIPVGAELCIPVATQFLH